MNLRMIAVGLVSMWALQAQATLMLTPAAPTIAGTGYGPANCEPECVETVFHTDDLQLLYKADVPGTEGGSVLEEGPFSPYYSTQFLNSATDPSGALITWLGDAWIDCGECYLAIKDGKSSPGYYFYDLSAWNGKEAISLSGFWPYQGAISHISIWGDQNISVPEPGTLSLLGAGLLLAGLRNRRKLLRQA